MACMRCIHLSTGALVSGPPLLDELFFRLYKQNGNSSVPARVCGLGEVRVRGAGCVQSGREHRKVCSALGTTWRPLPPARVAWAVCPHPPPVTDAPSPRGTEPPVQTWLSACSPPGYRLLSISAVSFQRLLPDGVSPTLVCRSASVSSARCTFCVGADMSARWLVTGLTYWRGRGSRKKARSLVGGSSGRPADISEPGGVTH